MRPTAAVLLILPATTGLCAAAGTAPRLQRRDCAWNSRTAEILSAASRSQQRVSPYIDCTGLADDCAGSAVFAVRSGPEHTFEGGGRLELTKEVMDKVQESFDFSRKYDVQEEQTKEVAGDYYFRAGTGGHLTFTPQLECTEGSFVGDCWDFPTGIKGRVCIPRVLAGQSGTVVGTWSNVVTI